MERERCVICDQHTFVDTFNIYNTTNIVSATEFNNDEIKKTCSDILVLNPK